MGLAYGHIAVAAIARSRVDQLECTTFERIAKFFRCVKPHRTLFLVLLRSTVLEDGLSITYKGFYERYDPDISNGVLEYVP